MACSNCFRGTVSLGQPTGEETTIHGLPTYVARPPDGAAPKGLVVMIPDAFGWDFVNNRVLCDRYASNGGFLVYLPDFMGGKGDLYLLTGTDSSLTLHTQRTLPRPQNHRIHGPPRGARPDVG